MNVPKIRTTSVNFCLFVSSKGDLAFSMLACSVIPTRAVFAKVEQSELFVRRLPTFRVSNDCVPIDGGKECSLRKGVIGQYKFASRTDS